VSVTFEWAPVWTVGDDAATATEAPTKTADTTAVDTSNASVRFIPASLLAEICPFYTRLREEVAHETVPMPMGVGAGDRG
jgi:hypothetical protein